MKLAEKEFLEIKLDMKNKQTIDERIEEQWRPIKSYIGLYEVSNLGRIRSLPRRVGGRLNNTGLITGKLLKCNPENGYLRVDLSKNGTITHKLVHRLVAEAFLSKSDERNYVNHKNFNRHDNSIENLEWCTREENTNHAIINGRMKCRKGIDHPNHQKTICKNGHPLSGDNVYIFKEYYRRCKACNRESARKLRDQVLKNAKEILGMEVEK